jgi:hypothetical protein
MIPELLRGTPAADKQYAKRILKFSNTIIDNLFLSAILHKLLILRKIESGNGSSETGTKEDFGSR